MHNLTPRIWEDMAFQRWLNINPSMRNRVIELCLDPWNKYFLSSWIFANLQTCRTSCEEDFVFWKCGLIRLQLILKNFRLSLMVLNTQEFENSNFPIKFKWSNFVNRKHHLHWLRFIPLQTLCQYCRYTVAAYVTLGCYISKQFHTGHVVAHVILVCLLLRFGP
jgi:hypothetical protein